MPSVASYAGTLRCIGQALQRQEIVVFELKSYASDFRLQCGDPNPPYTNLIQLSYTVDDIEALDQEGQTRRGRRSSNAVQFDSLPEVLRALGNYVDSKLAYLWRIYNADQSSYDPSIELEYETRARRLQAEKLPLSSILEMSTRMYKRRTKTTNPIDIFTGRGLDPARHR
jgi:hypothetical protein